MNIDQKLRAILTGSPHPVPAIENKVYFGTAKQTADKPYLVVRQISEIPMIALAQDENPLPTRRWRYQFTCAGRDFGEANQTTAAVLRLLVGYTDSPAAGIQRCVQITRGGYWDETDRTFLANLDLDIMENLPE